MSFDSFEVSQESSAPVELYAVTSGVTVHYFTSASFKVTTGGQDYLPVAVKRTSLKTADRATSNNMKIEMPIDHAVAALYKGSNPLISTTFLITRYQFNEGTTDSIVFFEGGVKDVVFKGKIIEFIIVPLESSTAKQIPKITFQSMCNVALYGPECKAVESNFQLTDTVINATGNEVTVTNADSETDGHWTGGRIVVNAESFWIVGHAGEVLTILGAFVEDIAGQTAVVSAGCAHDTETCSNKFTNLENYIGFPYVPLKNLYAQGLV